MNKIDRDTDYYCWDMVHKGDNRDTKSIEMDASWKALHDQIPKEPKQKGKRIFRGKDGKLKEYSPSEAWVKGNNFEKTNESKNVNKKLIRLTESDLHRIVKESVRRVLKESDNNLRELAQRMAEVGSGSLTDEEHELLRNAGYTFNTISGPGCRVTDICVNGRRVAKTINGKTKWY